MKPSAATPRPDTLIADRLRAAAAPPEPPAVPRPPAVPQPAPVCTDEAWRRAREDYERGVSAPVCAERHGLSPRTVRHRAAVENWRRRAPSNTFHSIWSGEAPPTFAGEPQTADDLMERTPELAMFLEAHNFEVGELLLSPDPARMGRFAFRRAAEAAARGAAAEAGGWMRLVALLQRVRAPMERDLRPVSEADLLRARYAHELRAAFAADGDGADGEPDP